MNNLNQKAIEKIRSGYEEREITKAEELKNLDKKVKRPAKTFAYIFGSLSSLVLGTGMCLAMKVIGKSLPMALGIGVGLAGIGLCTLNYFLYKTILKRRKAKYADQILSLCDQALNNGEN